MCPRWLLGIFSLAHESNKKPISPLLVVARQVLLRLAAGYPVTTRNSNQPTTSTEGRTMRVTEQWNQSPDCSVPGLPFMEAHQVLPCKALWGGEGSGPRACPPKHPKAPSLQRSRAMLLYLLSALCLNKLMARGVDGAPPPTILGLDLTPAPHD